MAKMLMVSALIPMVAVLMVVVVAVLVLIVVQFPSFERKWGLRCGMVSELD